jgi:hypothetical protein
LNGKATYFAIKFDALINSKMSFICPFCSRSFSRRTAYTQHVQKCIKKIEVEDDDVEMDTEGDQNSNDENDNVEVIMLFHVISYKVLNIKPKKSST